MKTIWFFNATTFLALTLAACCAQAGLLDNLPKLAVDQRLPVGDPLLMPTNGTDGPKSIVVADFDGDGKADIAVASKDGSITIYYGKGDTTFDGPVYLHAGTNELRGLAAADLFGAGRMDLAVTSPFEGRMYLLQNLGARQWAAPTNFDTWPGARDVVAGDFDGDGRADLVVAGSTNGLRHLRGLGAGAFMMMTNLSNGATTDFDFVQPAFYLAAFREPGATRDELATGRANFDGGGLSNLQVFATGPSGALEFRGVNPGLDFNAFDIGPVFEPASNGIPDLVLTDNNVGSVVVRRGQPASPARFGLTNEIFLCPGGGPRAVRLGDFDGDGWNDVAVVQSSYDKVLVFRNDHGSLNEWQVLFTGHKPREMALGDFNGDHTPDLAVLNRGSQDVSILNTGVGGGFGGIDQAYPTEGEPVGLEVRDLNHDGHDDVIQLLRSSGLLSVRLATTNGSLLRSATYPMGSQPSALSMYDVNGDGHLDALAACLGSAVVVRLGIGDGTFGPPITNSMPQQSWGGLFALFPADLDGDGFVDLAAGYFDCRLALFRGDGTGHFEFRSVQPFSYESHALGAADFDRDGDLDVVAFGYDGSVVVLENRGDLLTTTNFHKIITKVPNFYGAESARTGDFNHDGNPDILVSGGAGTEIIYGNGDGTFNTSSTLVLSGVSAASFALADTDGDGIDDLILGCSDRACVVVLKGASDGSFSADYRVAVPSSKLIAAGDLDGDGKADLVGTGSVLWTALSSRPPNRVPAPPPSANTNIVPARVFINEILAANSALPLAPDGGRKSDWLEVFCNIPGGTNVSGWRLLLEKTNFVSSVTNNTTNIIATVVTNTFTFPAGTVLSNGAHQVLVCSDTIRSPFHTGYKLPSDPAVLCLCDSSGVIVDRVEYPAQNDNIAYGRYRDGLPGFVASSNPSPGLPNVDDGPVPPTLEFDGVDPDTVRRGGPLRFFAHAKDDVGVRNVSLVWRRLDIADAQDHRVILFDDGENGDGAFGDGLYAGLLGGLPPDAAIQFYVECTDLSGEVTSSPATPVFVSPGQAPTVKTLALSSAPTALEISEGVADNKTGLTDELGGHPDWVEVRNTSTAPAGLAGLQLAGSFFGSSARFDLPASRVLAPGEHLVLYADAKTNQGLLHLPFSLDHDGDEVWLTRTQANGARLMIDEVKFGPQLPDRAWARLGASGPWRATTPTPGAQNLTGAWAGLIQTDGTFTFGFATQTNHSYTVEFIDSLSGGAWIVMPAVAGTGTEQSLTQPMESTRFFRVLVGP